MKTCEGKDTTGRAQVWDLPGRSHLGHDLIVFEGRDCPLCDALTTADELYLRAQAAEREAAERRAA